jgi:sugar phosphate isomerase/epimerase
MAVSTPSCDGGLMDAGPYYLGTGTEYFEREAVMADFSHMVEAGKKIGCPVILGSSGMAGGNRNLDWMVDLAKDVFAELHVRDAKVAVIGAELDPEIVIKELHKGALRATAAVRS